MPLYLIRHSRVAVSGLCYGQRDVPLAASFADEVNALQQQLHATFAGNMPSAWSSPSLRCTQLADALGLPVQLDSRLKELNFGEWEGKPWDVIDGPQARFWGNNWQTASPPGGESLSDLVSRIEDFIRTLANQDALLICHAGPIRVLWHLLGGLTLEQAFATTVPYARLLRL